MYGERVPNGLGRFYSHKSYSIYLLDSSKSIFITKITFSDTALQNWQLMKSLISRSFPIFLLYVISLTLFITYLFEKCSESDLNEKTG